MMRLAFLLLLSGCGWEPSVDLDCLDACYQDEKIMVSAGVEFAGWRMEQCVRKECSNAIP